MVWLRIKHMLVLLNGQGYGIFDAAVLGPTRPPKLLPRLTAAGLPGLRQPKSLPL